MADANVRLPLSQVVREMTLCVTITGERLFRFRLLCAKPLLRLVALIIGCGIEFKSGGDG